MQKKIEKKQIDRTVKTIAEIIKSIKEKYGAESILTGDDKLKHVDIDIIPTGSISLNYALGIGGIPRGRIIEIFGPEASGKTTLALTVVREAQKQGLIAAYIDAEHALDLDYAKVVGVNCIDLLISQPKCGEEALDIAESLVKTGKVGVIIIDSVAALTPQAEIDGEMGARHIGLQARLMSQGLRKLTAIASRANTAIVFINQIRMNIGGYGNPETTTGGVALKFYTSVRIEVRRSAKLEKGEEIIGNRIKVKIAKNKLSAPFKKTEYDIIFSEGISYANDVLSLGLLDGIIEKEGNSLIFEKLKLGRSLENAKEWLKENPKTLDEILNKIKEKHETVITK